MMEIKIWKYFFLVIGITMFASCQKEEEERSMLTDYYSVSFNVEVQNSFGDNLLDPDTPGNILDEEMYFIYNDIRYDIIQGLPEPNYSMEMHTRFLPTIWYGGYISSFRCNINGWKGEEGPMTLYIGEFPGDINGEWSIELYLGERKYELGYKTYFINVLDFKRKFFLNGEEHENAVYTFIL